MAKAKKTGKDALADGAKAIRDAEKAQKDSAKSQKAAAVVEKVEIPKTTRTTEEVVKDRVTVMPGNIGLKIDSETPIEESLQILDWTTMLSDHVGFMIGDVLNFSNAKWGDKYTAALNQTGRGLSTLKGYAETAKKIPYDKRVATLTYSHYRELIRLPDGKLDATLKEVGAQAEKGKVPTVREVRFKVQKLTPHKKAKRVTSGKGKRKPKVEAPPYEPTAEEQSKLDAGEEALQAAVNEVKTSKLYQIVAKLDNKEKKRWLAMAEPIVTFYNAVDRVTSDYY